MPKQINKQTNKQYPMWLKNMLTTPVVIDKRLHGRINAHLIIITKHVNNNYKYRVNDYAFSKLVTKQELIRILKSIK